jgi:hypothetical protein
MRILHTADLHLGFRQYGLAQREADFKHSAIEMLRQAAGVKADIVTIGGDNFDTPKPPGDAVEALKHAVAVAGVPVYGIDGNHDPAQNAWLRLAGVRTLDKWDGDRPVPEIIDGVALFGLNYLPPTKLMERLELIAVSGVHIDVLVLHAQLGDMFGMGIGLCDLMADDVASVVKRAGVRIVLLGDIHEYKEVVFRGVRFIYPGSPEVNSSSEPAEKSFSVIDITPSSLKTEVIEFKPSRKFMRFRVATPEDFITVRSAVEGESVPPIVVVDYHPDLENAKGTLEAILGDKAIYRVSASTVTAENGVTAMVVALSGDVDRAGVMRYLARALDESDASLELVAAEKELIRGLIQTPDNMQKILRDYLAGEFKL